MARILVALAAESNVLDFTSVDEAARVGTIDLPEGMGQDERDQLAMTLQTLEDAGEIRGWGSADTRFVVEGQTYTVAQMVATNVTEEDGYDWITADLIAIPPGGTSRVGMLEVTRPA